MHIVKNNRGFRVLVEEKYQNEPGEFTQLVEESSAIGDYDNSFDKPGSSFLWIGQDHHLNREQVKELISYLQHWLDNLSLDQTASKPEK